jgi:hypothetical protein
MSILIDGTEWNSRYVAYAKANGKSPNEMIEAHEKVSCGEQIEGVKSGGFHFFIMDKWANYWDYCEKNSIPVFCRGRACDEDHKRFDELLERGEI